MRIEWGSPLERKRLLFFFGWGWQKERFKMYEFYRDISGFTINFWRFAISYYNEGDSKERVMRKIINSAYPDSDAKTKEEKLDILRKQLEMSKILEV